MGVSCSCADAPSHCSVPSGIRECWKGDKWLQSVVPAIDKGDNRFFDEGIARDADMTSCDCYVVLLEAGSAVSINGTGRTRWYQVSYIFEIRARSRAKVRDIKDYLTCNWIPRLCGFGIPCGCVSKFRVDTFTDSVLEAGGMRLSTVTITAIVTKFIGECIEVGSEIGCS